MGKIMKRIKSNILIPKVYKTNGYIPRYKYTISVYDENMEPCGIFDNYEQVASFFETNSKSITEHFSRKHKGNNLKNKLYNGKKYTITRTRNGR